MSQADYIPGGNFGSGLTEFDGQCADKCVCDALDIGLSAITTALVQIDSTLERKLGGECEIVDKCKQQIIDLIEEHYQSAAKSCDECRAMIDAGLSGTLEFAVACAGACISDIKKHSAECSASDSEGTACATCGQEPCCCVDGECLPCETVPKVRYVGYCNRLTGLYSVTEQGQANPDPLATAVSLADTESVALAEAKEYCDTYYRPLPTEPPPAALEKQQYVTQFCDIGGFADGTAANTIVNRGAKSFSVAGLTELIQASARVGIGEINIGNLGEVLQGIYAYSVGSPPYIASLALPAMATALGCDNPAWISGLEVIAACGIVSKATGADLSGFTTSIEYVVNSVCRRKFISPEAATQWYLTNDVTLAALDAHFAVDGLCPQAVTQRIDTLKTRFTQTELVALYRRGIISIGDYKAGMRQLGWLDNINPQRILDGTLHTADIASVIRMQQQQATDDSQAQKQGLDSHSEQLYNGILHDYLRSHGVTDTEIKLLWRTHWVNPSVGNLIEFLHRLRDEKGFGGEAKLKQEFRDGMLQLGIPPYLHAHYEAVAFLPLQKRDIHTAYNSGSLATDKLTPALRKIGYADDAVAVLEKEFKPARRHAIQSHTALRLWTEQHISQAECMEQLSADSYDQETIARAMLDVEYKFETSSWSQSYIRGFMTRERLVSYLSNWGVSQAGCVAIADKLAFRIVDHKATDSYIAGTQSRDDAMQSMREDGLTSDVISQLLSWADHKFRNASALECTRGYKHRYLLGELSREETHNALIRNGIVLEHTNKLMSTFDCEKSAEGRQVAVEKLCHWLYIGSLSQPEFMDRLIRLGYTEENAALLLYDCVQANTLREIREAKQVAKEKQSAADKIFRAQQKAQATIDRNNAQLAKARKDKATLRANRDTQLLRSVERVVKATSADLVTANNAVKAALDNAQTQYGLDVDEALKIIVIASENMKGLELADFGNAVSQLADAASKSGLEPIVAGDNSAPSSNGATHPSG